MMLKTKGDGLVEWKSQSPGIRDQRESVERMEWPGGLLNRSAETAAPRSSLPERRAAHAFQSARRFRSAAARASEWPSVGSFFHWMTAGCDRSRIPPNFNSGCQFERAAIEFWRASDPPRSARLELRLDPFLAGAEPGRSRRPTKDWR